MKNNRPLRYIAYVRKSEERKERQELSHKAQWRMIKEQFPDLNIIDWVEESKSAFKPGRDLFDKQVMDRIKNGEAEGIVAYHPNRLSRNEIDSADITYSLRGPLKDLRFCNYNFENTAEGIMMLQMIMNQSQYESSKQGRDVKRGMKEKALDGERPGQVALGFIKTPVLNERGEMIRGKDKKPVTETKPDPERYDLVKKMWATLLSGTMSAAEVGKIASSDWGLVTRTTAKVVGGPLYPSMVYKIFNNPFYAGYIPHNGELYKGSHFEFAMITLEEFDYVQRLLGSKGKPRTGVNPYAFTGLIKCGTCGCSIVAKTNVKFNKGKGEYKTYVHYYCTRKSIKRPCNQNKYTSIDAIEKEIDEELAKYSIIPEFRDLAIKILRRKVKQDTKDRTSIYDSLQKARNQKQAQLDKLLDLLTREVIDEESYKKQNKALLIERDGIDDKLRHKEKLSDEQMELTEKAFHFATYSRTQFNETKDLNVKRDILKTLGESLTLNNGKLTIVPNEWLVPIRDNYPSLEKRFMRVGTKKKAHSKELEQALEPIIESWRASGDLNPGHPA